MMGRAPFYAPFPGMWGGAFGAAASSSNPASKQSSYSASSGGASGANFGYPPTPPKDGTPDNHQVCILIKHKEGNDNLSAFLKITFRNLSNNLAFS
jgi:hypothetical protein